MSESHKTILIMAAGTGGHVFPALAIARTLMARGLTVEWLASMQGMENELLRDTDIEVHRVAVKGLQGKGIMRMIAAPLMLVRSLLQCLSVLRKLRPVCVLGMGGYVSGPGGVAARLLRIPLVLHEQNAVAGYTNFKLRKMAAAVLQAFPGTFTDIDHVMTTGNPLRQEIVSLHQESQRDYDDERGLNLLVLGGSQGARALNQAVPEAMAMWDRPQPVCIQHQTGELGYAETLAHYRRLGLTDSDRYRVQPFIKDMASAYRWADLVVCRSGASTVSELAAARLPSVLVPYPHHKDQQQLRNASWLCEAGAGLLMNQSELNAASLLAVLVDLDSDRQRLRDMSEQAAALAILDASDRIATTCMEVAHVG